jgi:S1-C subfamily serine protease
VVADALYGTMNMRSMGAMGLLTLFFLLLLPLITTTTYTTSGVKEAGAQAPQVNNTLTLSLPELYSNVEDSVVQITATTTTTATAGNDTTTAGNETSPVEIRQESLIWSGFIYDNGGHIITSYYVLAGANPDDINITFSDGTIYGARVIGTDAYSNLAVLRLEDEVPADKLVPLPLGNSTALKIGEQVATIGHPFDLGFGVLTAGTVAQTGVLLPGPVDNTSSGPEFSIPDTIAADLLIGVGNSGGPLFNMKGEVVGITVSSAPPTSISVSIPSNTIAKIAPALIETGSYQHPWLGISGMDMTPEIAEAIGLGEPRGFLVTEAAPGGPADAAGVQGGNTSMQLGGMEIPIGGDVILALDDRDVRRLNDLLGYLEQSTQVGDEVTLIAWRDGQTIEIPVTVGARPSLQGSP